MTMNKMILSIICILFFSGCYNSDYIYNNLENMKINEKIKLKYSTKEYIIKRIY